MGKFKILSQTFTAIAVLLSDAMCAVIGYKYCTLQWGGRYVGWSAPPSVAFVYAVPFAAGIVLCIILSRLFGKKASTNVEDSSEM